MDGPAVHRPQLSSAESWETRLSDGVRQAFLRRGGAFGLAYGLRHVPTGCPSWRAAVQARAVPDTARGGFLVHPSVRRVGRRAAVRQS